MARRSAPPGSGPAYLSPSFGSGGPSGPGGRLHDSSSSKHDANSKGENENEKEKEKEKESAVGKFLREEVFAPQHFVGNVGVLSSVLVFLGGVFVVRRWGDVLTVGLD